MDKLHRIQILPNSEITDLYHRPEFNNEERLIYFSFNESEITYSKKYSNVKTRVNFMLQLGYFKAKQQIFKFNLEDVVDDLQFIWNKYFSNQEKINFSGSLSKSYLLKQKKDLLDYFNYNEWLSKETEIKAHIARLFQIHSRVRSVYRELNIYLEYERIVTPSYRTLQDLFTSGLSFENSRISSIILKIPKKIQAKIELLIQQKNGISQLSIIRSDQKNFKYTAIKLEVKKASKIYELFLFSKSFIPLLKLSKNSIYYYADLIDQYNPSRLRKLDKYKQLLYVICFIHLRYRQIMDNLIISFIYQINTIMNDAKDYSKEARIIYNNDIVSDLPKLSKFLSWYLKREKDLTKDEQDKLAFKILPENRIIEYSDYFNGISFDKEESKWIFYNKISRKIATELRPIILNIDFTYYKENDKLTPMIKIIKDHYKKGKSPSSLKISVDNPMIPKSIIKYLQSKSDPDYLNPHLFEFFVYKKIYHQIDRGRLCCNNSLTYNDINIDLVDDVVSENVEEISKEFGYDKIAIFCDERLDNLLEELDSSWEKTTQNIIQNKNSNFKVKVDNDDKEVWSLTYEANKKNDHSFFKSLPKIEISNMLMFIGDLTNIWSSFTHIKGKYTKQRASKSSLNATILSESFGLGSVKMSDICDIPLNTLRATREDFIRMDTICNANDLISNYIQALPIFKQWNLIDDNLVADADGQKFSTSDSTIQTRFSKKYFRSGKGISIYSLVGNYIAINAKNLGLNEYEGHSLYDLIFNNKSEVVIDKVTGDNHSLNKLNFIALDSINVDFIPSIKNIFDASNTLYSSKPINSYNGILKPKKQVDKNLIKSQKKGITRVLLSLILQENTQHIIIKKLNSHSRYARLRAALFEYNNIFKSIHILNMIDDISLRKVIRSARNRTEAYHQLQRFIRKVHTSLFKGKRVVNNKISTHSSRLIANCIVCYNSIILNKIYEKMIKENVDKDLIDRFIKISPIAWSHLIFSGKYNFKKGANIIDINAMLHLFEKYAEYKI